MHTSLCDLPLVDVAALLRRLEISPVELLRQALERVAQLNPHLNAIWTVTAELAMEQARAAETEIGKGGYRGALHGIPIALKDLIFTRGIRTTSGSKIFADFIPDYDSTVVEKLRSAGAVLVGKASMHEFAYGITNDNPHFGPTRNPWDRSRTPGGSSGGSAVAVATGMCFASIGTDTGGSIRLPSSFCGVAGLKPTFGRVSMYGVFPLGFTLDHVGPIARTVADVGAVYQIIAGFDARDPQSAERELEPISLRKTLDGFRMGVDDSLFFESVEPEVARLTHEALGVLEGCGARLIRVPLPEMEELNELNHLILGAEAYTLHRERLQSRAEDFGPDVRKLLERGSEISAAEYIDAQVARGRLRRKVEQLFQEVDLLVMPTTPVAAFPLGDTELGSRHQAARQVAMRLLRPFNVTGHPALSVCCGFTAADLPVGIQIAGRLWDEAKVLRAGYAYEQATEWHFRRPPAPGLLL